MLSGCKVRFDKACKYHPGNEEANPDKFQTWLRRTKTAFRRTAYLCRLEIDKLDPLDPDATHSRNQKCPFNFARRLWIQSTFERINSRNSNDYDFDGGADPGR